MQDKEKMADPADVAKDGYNALMNDEDKVVSGTNNKIQAAMSNLTPDSTLAAKVYKQQAPVYPNKGKERTIKSLIYLFIMKAAVIYDLHKVTCDNVPDP